MVEPFTHPCNTAPETKSMPPSIPPMTRPQTSGHHPLASNQPLRSLSPPSTMTHHQKPDPQVTWPPIPDQLQMNPTIEHQMLAPLQTYKLRTPFQHQDNLLLSTTMTQSQTTGLQEKQPPILYQHRMNPMTHRQRNLSQH